MSTYTQKTPAQDGTVCWRVITYLRTMPAGTKVSSAELSIALPGVIIRNMSKNARASVRAGLLKCEKAPDSHALLWSLPNEDEAHDDRIQRVISAAKAPRIRTQGLPSIFHLGERIASQQARNA